jgi:hypothetical protein
MGQCRPDGHITVPRNTRMQETSRRQRRMEASLEGGQGTEGAVAPQTDGAGTCRGYYIVLISQHCKIMLVNFVYSRILIF